MTVELSMHKQLHIIWQIYLNIASG